MLRVKVRVRFGVRVRYKLLIELPSSPIWIDQYQRGKMGILHVRKYFKTNVPSRSNYRLMHQYHGRGMAPDDG